MMLIKGTITMPRQDTPTPTTHLINRVALAIEAIPFLPCTRQRARRALAGRTGHLRSGAYPNAVWARDEDAVPVLLSNAVAVGVSSRRRQWLRTAGSDWCMRGRAARERRGG